MLRSAHVQAFELPISFHCFLKQSTGNGQLLTENFPLKIWQEIGVFISKLLGMLPLHPPFNSIVYKPVRSERITHAHSQTTTSIKNSTFSVEIRWSPDEILASLKNLLPQIIDCDWQSTCGSDTITCICPLNIVSVDEETLDCTSSFRFRTKQENCSAVDALFSTYLSYFLFSLAHTKRTKKISNDIMLTNFSLVLR